MEDVKFSLRVLYPVLVDVLQVYDLGCEMSVCRSL